MKDSIKHEENSMPKVMAGGTNVFPIIIPKEGSVVFTVFDKCFIGVIHITSGFFNRVFLLHVVWFKYSPQR